LEREEEPIKNTPHQHTTERKALKIDKLPSPEWAIPVKPGCTF
jgi:hypothetical protein